MKVGERVAALASARSTSGRARQGSDTLPKSCPALAGKGPTAAGPHDGRIEKAARHYYLARGAIRHGAHDGAKLASLGLDWVGAGR